jgi:hypothetical protein
VKQLQTVALGLIVVFLDVGTPDWVADPLGWILVLIGLAAVRERLADYAWLRATAWVCLALAVVTWPPDSVPYLDDTIGWLFSLPTLAFCFLLADSLYDVTEPGLAQRFRVLCWLYALVTVLPLLWLLAGWEWLATPTTVLTILVNVVLVISLFAASDEDAVVDPAQSDAADSEPEETSTADSGSDDSGGRHKA